MRRTRRATHVAATAAVAAAALLVAGCSGGGDDDTDGDVLDVLVVKHGLTGRMVDMEWVSQLEEAAGVTIRWEEVTSDWDQKKAAMLPAGDVPDLIIGGNAITDADLAVYSSLFEDLSDDMESLPNVAAMFAEQPRLEAMATQQDGAVYSLPSYKRFWPETIGRQYINQTWLDNLGLDVPTTWDELLEVLQAFKEFDANGNGDPDDEIPWDWGPFDSTGGFAANHPTMLLGSLGLPLTYGGTTGYVLEDGVVSSFLVDERYKQVVAFAHEAYAAGLVSEQVLTQDYSTYQSVARGEGDVAAVGFGWGWTASDRFGAQLAEQYTSMAPLLAEPGQTTPVTWSYDDENYTPNHITMSADVGAGKEAALAVINAFYDQDISVQVLWGAFGTNVEKTGEDSYEVLPPADGTSDPSTWKWTTTLADAGPFWIRDDIDVVLPADIAEAVEQSEPLQEAFANIDPETDIYPFKYVKISAEDQSTITLNNTAILNVAMSAFARWLTEGGIEEEWDGYVSDLEAAGLSANVEIYQRYYDAYREGQG
ncbi:MAG TPA: extracellular solute-binding protein [Actinotalea caeni]|uniref:extracellular solute-binding protein n=1 Tax=Actinotalea caeni TaxID=1348467 RepID=UPI002B4B63FA|nr:extracellular solute-binding protein [Actinotalea caeni]HLV53941.1 extracellular solute-binding protein [Actinotalea caeni]